MCYIDRSEVIFSHSQLIIFFSFTVYKPVCVKDSSGEGTCLFLKKHNGNMESSFNCPLHNVYFGKQS